VRLLSVVASLGVHDTDRMSGDTRPTVFVTGAAGFLGTELVTVLVHRGYEVLGLVESAESARALRHAGATAVIGDLRMPGQWQDEAGADWVFHIPPATAAGHGRWRSACRASRSTLDTHLLDAVAGVTRRIVYVADSRSYRPTGARPVTEDEIATARTRKARRISTLDRLDGYLIAGLPIVTAIPGCVYGNGSWFRTSIVEPVMACRRVVQFGAKGPWVSPIHVHDCARALMHLAEHGEVGSRYFVANTDPIRMSEFAEELARIAKRPLRRWLLPAAAAGLLAPRPLADQVDGNAVFSNIRLRGSGFRFRYPTVDQGIAQILGALHE
jgi:nucleoside-diphosphate-sugar epimerase